MFDRSRSLFAAAALALLVPLVGCGATAREAGPGVASAPLDRQEDR